MVWNSCVCQRKGPWAFLPPCPRVGQKGKVERYRAWVLSAVKYQKCLYNRTRSFCRNLSTSSLVRREGFSELLEGFVDLAMIIHLHYLSCTCSVTPHFLSMLKLCILADLECYSWEQREMGGKRWEVVDIAFFYWKLSLAYLCCPFQPFFPLGVVRKKVNLVQQLVPVRGFEFLFYHTGRGTRFLQIFQHSASRSCPMKQVTTEWRNVNEEIVEWGVLCDRTFWTWKTLSYWLSYTWKMVNSNRLCNHVFNIKELWHWIVSKLRHLFWLLTCAFTSVALVESIPWSSRRDVWFVIFHRVTSSGLVYSIRNMCSWLLRCFLKSNYSIS